MPGRMAWTALGGRFFPAPRLPGGPRAVGFVARAWAPRSGDMAVMVFVVVAIVFIPVAFPARNQRRCPCRDTARPRLRSRSLSESSSSLASVSPVPPVLPARIASLRSCSPSLNESILLPTAATAAALPASDETALHLVGQLGELGRRNDGLRALLQQAARSAGQSSAASESGDGQCPLHLVKSAQEVPGRDGKA